MQISISGTLLRSCANALLEFTQNRGDMASLLQPRPKLVKPLTTQQPTAPSSKGFKGAKGAGKNQKKAPRAPGNRANGGYRKCGKAVRRKCFACDIRWGNVPTRIADLSMLVDFQNQTAQLVEDLTQPWSMIRHLTDFRM